MENQSWAYSTTSHGLTYALCSQKKRSRHQEGRRCTLISASIADHDFEFDIPCFHCSGFSGRRQYFHHYEDQYTDMIRCHLPNISYCCASDIADTFIATIFRRAVASHRCPLRRQRPVKTVTVNFVELVLQSNEFREEDVMEISFEEAGPAMTKPASCSVVEQLRNDKLVEKEGLGIERFESGWSDSDHVCVICMDKVKTRLSSLALSCSHVFHEDCIVAWLETSHVCPLCRYAMPTED